ncbi:MAG: hypothetical protein DRQ46_00490 [Gammaproteobacteria bacterium]|nr:MAG: hypothetical protein DRQ46_00490 [Gammaproteobacteria bacterium]
MAQKILIETVVNTGKAKAEVKSLGTSFKDLAIKVGGAVVAYKALKTAGQFMSESVKMAKEQKDVYKTLEVTINNTGASYKAANAELQKLFATQQKNTIYGDTESAAMLTKLIERTGDYETAVNNLALAQDMASSTSFDASSATNYLGMALAGNIEMLGRYIPELKSSVNEQLKSMTATEKSAYAVDLLTKKYGGLSTEVDENVLAAARLENTWGDAKESLGDALLPAVTEATKGLIGLSKAAESFFGMFDTSKVANESIARAAENIKIIQDTLVGTPTAILKDALADQEEYFKGLISGLEKYPEWQDEVEQTRQRIVALNNAIKENAIVQEAAAHASVTIAAETKATEEQILIDYVNRQREINAEYDAQEGERLQATSDNKVNHTLELFERLDAIKAENREKEVRLEEEKNKTIKAGVRTLGQDLLTLSRSFGKKGFLIAKRIAQANAIVKGAEAAVAAWNAGMSVGTGPVALAAAFTFMSISASATAAQIQQIEQQKYAKGGDFITDGPQSILVGDNPGGRERVTITPMSSPNYNGPQGGDNTDIINAIERLNETIIDNRTIVNVEAKTIDPVKVYDLAQTGQRIASDF